MVSVYVFKDRVLRDEAIKTRMPEYGKLVGKADSARRLEELIGSMSDGCFAYFVGSVPLPSFEDALEELGVDPQSYLA